MSPFLCLALLLTLLGVVTTQEDSEDHTNQVSLQVAPLVPTIVKGNYSKFTLSTTLVQVGHPFTATCQLTVPTPTHLYYSDIFRNGSLIYGLTFTKGNATLKPDIYVNPHKLKDLVVRPLGYNFTSAQVEITPSAVGTAWYECGTPNAVHVNKIKVTVVKTLPKATL